MRAPRRVGGSFLPESATARDGSAGSPGFRACFEVSTLTHQPLVNVKYLDLTLFLFHLQLALFVVEPASGHRVAMTWR